MAFAEELSRFGPWYRSGWSPRPESAEEIAARVQAMARGLDQAEPAFGGLWAGFDVRALRPSDPGPVQEMSKEDLGRLIDRRGRFDPPQLPMPVGPDGYSFSVVSQRGTEGFVRSNIRAGSRRPGTRNTVDFEFGRDCAIWRDVERGAAVLRVLVDAWSPEWVVAADTIVPEDPDAPLEFRPWLAWRQRAAPASPYWPEFANPPVIVRDEAGGELSIWP